MPSASVPMATSSPGAGLRSCPRRQGEGGGILEMRILACCSAVRLVGVSLMGKSNTLGVGGDGAGLGVEADVGFVLAPCQIRVLPSIRWALAPRHAEGGGRRRRPGCRRSCRSAGDYGHGAIRVIAEDHLHIWRRSGSPDRRCGR